MNRKSAAFILTAVLVVSALFAFAGCGKKESAVKVENLELEHEQEFGGVYLKMKIDDFNAKGFTYGDSVDVVFSNGYKLEDIPYYNGYYVAAGDPLLIAYPGYDYIKAAVNYGDDLWDTAKLGDAHCTGSIILKEKGKYRDIQEARDIHYYDERERYDSDEIFANFREMNVGGLKEKTVYRSASPCDNQHNRAPYVDALIKNAGIRCILNLADNNEKIEKYIKADGFASPYFLSLYNDGKVIPLALSMNYNADDFKSKIAQGFIAMLEKEGPYLVHCTEGKDRTGFVCMLIEALAGASYQEIADDYMKTYDNYYWITREKEKTKYDTILSMNLDAMILAVCGDKTADVKKADLAGYARNYLISAGMTESQVDRFTEIISR